MASRLSFVLALAVVPLFLAACDSNLSPVDRTTAEVNSQGTSHGIVPGRSNIVEITPSHHHDHDGEVEHQFELSTDEVPSGWTTFRFDNSEAHVTHFAYLAKMPNDDITAEQYRTQVTEPFQPFLTNLEDGFQLPDDLTPLFDLPEWFDHVVFRGGVGLTGPGQMSQSTVYLEPGNYIVECYVKTEDNRFHSYYGMLEDFDVTSESSDAPEPRSTLNVTLSREKGLQLDGHLRPGKHTFEVNFENQDNYGGFGHDVHLIRLENTHVDDVKEWMDWTDPNGLVSSHDNPGPQTFLGGMHDVYTPGKTDRSATAYFTAVLEPGDYALLSEVPYQNPLPGFYPNYPEGLDKLVETFTVPTRRGPAR